MLCKVKCHPALGTIDTEIPAQVSRTSGDIHQVRGPLGDSLTSNDGHKSHVACGEL